VKLLLVTFSLRNRRRDYDPFFVALRGNALQWWHFIEQTCVISTNAHTPDSLTHELLPHIETTDSLLIVEITPHQMQGWLPPHAWNWLNSVSETIAAESSLPLLFPPPGSIVK